MVTEQVKLMPKIRTLPMDSEWKSRLQKRNRNLFTECPHLVPLRDKLLSLAGEETCLPSVEKDLPLLLSRGEVFLGKGSILRKGEPCRCHSNSAYLWDANSDKLAICTGYALSRDGLWRQHSWLVFKSTGGSVVETTVRRLLYFGVRLTDMESESFFFANC